jgi:hypothetical protein
MTVHCTQVVRPGCHCAQVSPLNRRGHFSTAAVAAISAQQVLLTERIIFFNIAM